MGRGRHRLYAPVSRPWSSEENRLDASVREVYERGVPSEYEGWEEGWEVREQGWDSEMQVVVVGPRYMRPFMGLRKS